MSPATAVLTVPAVEDEPHRDLKRTGQPLPEDWQALFLGYYAEYGTFWRACKLAGVSSKTVERYRASDPTFAAQVEDARQEFADSQEHELRLIGEKGNPVGPIVLLKKHRPHEFIEKTVNLSLTATTELPHEDGKILLLAMLGQPAGVVAAQPALPQTRTPEPGEPA